MLEGQISFPLVVRYRAGKPSATEEIEQTLIDTPSGAKVASICRGAYPRGPRS